MSLVYLQTLWTWHGELLHSHTGELPRSSAKLGDNES